MNLGEIIFQAEHFLVDAAPRPFVSREEGGHIRILPKKGIKDRTKLPSKHAVELMRLSMILGEALVIGMKDRGVEIRRVNYLDMGNWTPSLHIHILGRAFTATKQKYGEAVYLPKRKTGFYDSFVPLNKKDIGEIQKAIKVLLETNKYKYFG